MQEDILKDIFNNYEPETSSRMDFMDRLEKNLDAVELIHKVNADALKRNRHAVISASVAGFISGLLFSLLMPFINDFICSYSMMLSTDIQIHNKITGYQTVVLWLIVGAVSVLISLYTYKTTLRRGTNFLLLKGGLRED